MPLFEYRCKECGRRFALLVGMTAEKAKLECPACGSRKATKLISRIARVPRDDDFDDDLGDLGDMPDEGEGFDDDEGPGGDYDGLDEE